MTSTPFFTVQCSPCYGSGFLAEEVACSVCKGEGLIVLDGNAQDYMDCPVCSGSGFNGFDRENTCTRCQGVGALKKTPVVRKGVRK